VPSAPSVLFVSPNNQEGHHAAGRSNIEDSVESFERKGFDGQFIMREGAQIECAQCRGRFSPNEIEYVGMKRVDFETDPGQQSLIAALVCPSCRAKGTYSFTYGAGADANEGDILRILREQRKDQRPPM
jgi:hypothetical protein